MAGSLETNRAPLFRWALCATLLSTMAMCPRLWTSARAFPTVPVFAGLPEFPAWASVGLTLSLVLGVLAFAALPNPRLSLWVVFGTGAALVLFDIDRLQPWFYQALLLLLALGSPPLGENMASEGPPPYPPPGGRP